MTDDVELIENPDEERGEPSPTEAPARRPLIFFSGGMDSTFLLWRQLTHFGPADIIYAAGGQGKLKARAEANARHEVLHWLSRNAPHRVIGQFKVEDRFFGDASNPHWWEQPMSWFVNAIRHVNPATHSSVEVGTVMGDQFASRAAYAQEAWKQLWYAMSMSRYEMTPLIYPLLSVTKESILDAMPGELLKLTWTCEVPLWSSAEEIEACGKCLPCITHQGYEYYKENRAEAHREGRFAEYLFRDYLQTQQRRQAAEATLKAEKPETVKPARKRATRKKIPTP